MNFTRLNEGAHSWPFVYFHGNAERLVNKYNPEESWCAPDLVASPETKLLTYDLGEHTSIGQIINGCEYHVAEGIYDCKVYGMEAVLYLWTRAMSKGTKDERMAGLICLSDDEESKTYALKKFNERSSFL